ncbi:ABC transporter substrate-binding protein [Nocardia sp. NPDC052278]|uniref:ABC transporter substrate-binding protein n=1 Tax=unclassified Nocardia TaxID=2637762 RepID=UPI00369AD4FA
MTPIPITLACGDYDRTAALRSGEIAPAGIDLNYLTMPPEEIFYRMLKFREFDAAEMSLSSYLMSLERSDEFLAIPVFPSRTFRHNAVYVNTTAGIETPADLIGKRVGVPEYQMTAAVFIRGALADRHGLPVAGPKYRTGGLHQPGRSEKLPLPAQLGVDIAPIPDDRTLDQMLVAGDLDALYSARMPHSFHDGNPAVARLFRDPRRVEEKYFTDTGVFPIMHTVVVRRDRYDKNPWIVRSLYEAFEHARALAVAQIRETNALRYMLPWLYDEFESTTAVMGADYWPYGVEANTTVLGTFLRYSLEQGLTTRQFAPTDLFAAETLDAYTV